MDLIGIPIRLTIGKYLQSGQIELKLRNEQETKLIKLDNIVKEIENIINNNI